MDIWARAQEQDRAALFAQTAAAKGISPEIAEKDFWVCWILRQVFGLQDFPRIIFKGGTSLSKAFAIIARFSEDVDLVIINRHELGSLYLLSRQADGGWYMERAKCSLRARTLDLGWRS
jgi:predicted nucleotidyltransferase component of viral defense system